MAGVIRSEYLEAIELIHRLREGDGDPGHGNVRHWSLPAGDVSADFLCTAEHGRNGWFCFLADAAGHGLASAIFALHTPMLFRESVMLGMSLPAIYDRIDRFLVRQGISNFFVCGLLARIKGRDIEVVNAGMPDGLLLGDDDGLLATFPSSNLPFGIEKALGATSQHFRLRRAAGASLLICSDGLVDIPTPSGEMLGAEGLRSVLGGSADDVFDRLVEQVRQAGENIHDDVSIALIHLPLASHSCAADHPDVDGALASAASPDPLANTAAALRIVEHFDRGLILADSEQRILYVNPAFTEITGYSPAEAVGQTPRLLSSGRQDAEFYRRMWEALLDRGMWSGEIWNRRKDGSVYLEWLDLRALRDEAGTTTHFLATFTDLTRHEREEVRLHHLAMHDPLTGLANRTLLANRGRQAMHRADRADRAMAVLFIDLDRFNIINNSFGHDLGDRVLVEVSRRLASVLGEDDILSRFGSDEFICLLSDIACREDAGLVATKLLGVLVHPVEVAGHRFKVGASIGISAYPSDGHDLSDLMGLADRAMQSAKQAGGNIFRFFASGMAVSVERQLKMESRLAAAIDNGELELYYQPKLDLETRQIVGAEALLRWRDPQRGLVLPDAFIPLAERSDLIVRIGNWVLHEACAALKRWRWRLPDAFQLAINVSPLQFVRSDLAGEIRTALAAYQVPPGLLQIEVTESIFIGDVAEAERTLKALGRLGVGIALDDFGTGYSNLGSLSGLPFRSFKTPQSFVRDVHCNLIKAAIAKAVSNLADGLGREVVAEGIENCDECLQLQSFGYRIGQGNRFGEPMPEAEFVAHMKHWLPEHCACPVGARPAPE